MSSIEIRTIIVGSLDTNCYLLTESESRETYIVDPGDDADYILDVLTDLELKPTKLLATHGHFDHILAMADLQLRLNLPFLIHRKDQFLLDRATQTADYFLGTQRLPTWIEPKPTEYFDVRSDLKIGANAFHVIETPGHTPGSVCFYLPSEDTVLVGDLLFAEGGVGRTDYSYGREKDLKLSLQKILKLPEKTNIFPGHGAITTVAEAARYFNKGEQNVEPPQH